MNIKNIMQYFSDIIVLFVMTSRFFYFISPYMETGDLRSALDLDERFLHTHVQPKMNQALRLKILYQVARAIDYLHTPVKKFR